MHSNQWWWKESFGSNLVLMLQAINYHLISAPRPSHFQDSKHKPGEHRVFNHQEKETMIYYFNLLLHKSKSQMNWIPFSSNKIARPLLGLEVANTSPVWEWNPDWRSPVYTDLSIDSLSLHRDLKYAWAESSSRLWCIALTANLPTGQYLGTASQRPCCYPD